MPRRRDPFGTAMEALRQRLRDGDAHPGAPLVITDIAIGLNVSATPVREALSRLAGQGLIEDRRGRGYFVHRQDMSDLEQAYRLHQTLVLGALHADGEALWRSEAIDWPPSREAGGRDPTMASWRTASERLFAAIVRGARNPALSAMHQTIADRLALVRRHEPSVLVDVGVELEAMIATLRGDDAAALGRAVETYHARRLSALRSLFLAIHADSTGP